MEEEKKVPPADLEKAPVVDSGDIPAEIIKHANDADEAFQGHEGEIIVLDEATNQRLLKKIDFHLMPVFRQGYCDWKRHVLMRATGSYYASYMDSITLIV